MTLPFFDKNEKILEKKIKIGEYEEIDGPEDLKRLIRNLLKINPNERITYNEIKKLPFLEEYFNAYE